MHTEKREDPLVELGYEVRDLNTKALKAGFIGFFAFAIGSAVIGFWIFRVMNPAGFAAPSTLKRTIPQDPNPLLQSNMTSKTDIMDIRQHEEAIMDAPIGWADPAHTKLHLPIDRAMEIIAERGVPKTGANVPAISKGHTPNPAIGEKPGITLSTTNTPTGGSAVNVPAAPTNAPSAPKKAPTAPPASKTAPSVPPLKKKP